MDPDLLALLFSDSTASFITDPSDQNKYNMYELLWALAINPPSTLLTSMESYFRDIYNFIHNYKKYPYDDPVNIKDDVSLVSYTYRDTDNRVMVKTSRIVPGSLNSLELEAQLFALANKDAHPNSARFYDSIILPHHVSCIVQYESLSLLHYLLNHRNDCLKYAVTIMLHCALFFDYLQNCLGIAHLDIKWHNILIAIKDGKPCPIIIDYGMSKQAFDMDKQACDMENEQKLPFRFPFHDLEGINNEIEKNKNCCLQHVEQTSHQTFVHPYSSRQDVLKAFDLPAAISAFSYNKTTIYFEEWQQTIPIIADRTPSQFYQYAIDILSALPFTDASTGYFHLRPGSPAELYSACSSSRQGLPLFHEGLRPFTTISGTYMCMAPECIALDKDFHNEMKTLHILPAETDPLNPPPVQNPFKADNYSLGILFYTLLTHNCLYLIDDQNKKFSNEFRIMCESSRHPKSEYTLLNSVFGKFKNKGSSIFSEQHATGPMFLALLNAMLHFDPSARLDIKGIIARLYDIIALL